MQSIGERFEEARKRKGISLREAAEATKIRSDFLGNIEQNKFNFDLPEIYKRGFLKNYARYLKLDPENILTDYSAHLLSKSRSTNKGAELFGSMDVRGTSTEAEDHQHEEPSYGRISANTPASDVEEDEPNFEDESDKIFYIKAGLVAIGTLALVVVIFGLIKAILGNGDNAEIETPDLRDPAAITETIESAEASNPASNEESITLIASGNVYVLVKQRNDNQELFRKTLSEGETITLAKSGPIDILFTAGENLVIVNPAGEKLRPKGEGTAKISIP
ncbi:MAG: helix-turn-helix domain-containing protein [Opitutae bacterium]|jgi:cytoskeleton protein RodZ|nr:helix-turn-helix domain-containing protein [Opitutae bacterium]